MNIIYMGSGNFAVAPLERLLLNSYNVVAVFTAPPRVEKGTKIVKNTLHEFAESQSLRIYTPLSLKSEEEAGVIDSINADIIVVASYGQILKESILNSKRLGAINIHPSALPRFRGPSPLQHTILSGDRESAVCIMKMDSGVDTGPILLRSNFEVHSDIYLHQLESHCSNIGACLLIEVLKNFQFLDSVKQDQALIGASYAKMIKKSDGLIDWNKSAAEIERSVRAFAKWPVSFFKYKGETIRVFKAQHEPWHHTATPGTVIDANLGIACREGVFRPLILQRAGKKSLLLEAFLRGFSIASGESVY
jgi:methionyl-tRNA formyltransferase